MTPALEAESAMFPNHRHNRAHSTANLPGAPNRYLFHFAAEYVDRGWCVIPLHGKRPALPSWKEYQEHRPTLRQVREWFGDKSCQFNIGIVTGRVSDLVVVDCDTPADAEFWMANYPASPLMVATGGGGMHFYYRGSSEVVRNRAGVLGRRIDVRGEGGLVAAPPSLHPVTGKAYTWSQFPHISLDDVPEFQADWMGRSVPSPSPDESSWTTASLPRSGRIARRVKGLIRYLDEHESEPDRSKRDFACVLALLRIGCSPAEVANIVRGHSKFRDNEAYLEITIANARKVLLG